MDTSGKFTPGLDGERRVASRIDNASSGAHGVIDRLTEAAHPAMERMSSSAHRTVNRAAGVAAQTAEAFDAKREQLRNARLRAMEETRVYVRANPMMSLGIAVAAGFLFGRVLRARKK